MSYLDSFKHADDIVAHLDTVVPSIADPLLRAKYVGVVAVAAVTVYELSIKTVFVDFADRKHRVFGTFTDSHFNRINGRISLKALKDEHIRLFGEKYLLRFKKKLGERSAMYLRLNRRDFRSSYGNIVSWRHSFAHQGKVSTTATYEEAVQSYVDGKEVVHCLAESMVR